MSLFAQHGHGKSDKITTALAGTLDGVIFGARNEKPEKLAACLEDIRESFDVELLVDPQFYVCTQTPPNDRYLPDYPYYEPGRTAADFASLRRLRRYVEQTLDFQHGLGLDRIISPSVLFDSFDDRWSQIALNLADASLEYHASLQNAPPLLLTFCFQEQALTDRRELDGFLDQITAWNLAGLYLLVAREDSIYSPSFEPARLKQLLYTVYVLSNVNGFEVVCGYSDFVGLLLRAVGARAFSNGWSQGLRQFHRRNLVRQRPGGQPPRFRYSSKPLLASILLGELQQVCDVGMLDEVLSGVPLDAVITSAASPEASDWNARTSELHHWETLKDVDSILTGDLPADLDFLQAMLERASELYVELKRAGVVFERATTGVHAREWTDAITDFRSEIGV
jgi:hypothetical protein